MLYLSLKEEVENLEEDGIYIPNLVITFDIQIEITDKNTEFTKITTEKTEPSDLKNKILIDYIIEELRSKLEEEIEKAIKKKLYRQILEIQEYYYIENLKLTEQIDTLFIDKKDIVMGDLRYSILRKTEDNTDILKATYKAIKTFNFYIQLTLKEIMQKIIKQS
jgi:Uma2 family endonuclease